MLKSRFNIKNDDRICDVNCFLNEQTIIVKDITNSLHNKKERFINLSSIHKITNTNKSFTIYYDNGKEISFYDQEFNVINEWLNAIHINISSNSSQITEKSFNIIAEISRSKYSVIKLVENKSTHKQYAMKIINKSLLSAQNKIHTAMTERNILMQVNHPFIVNLYYSFQNTTNFYFVMEYMKSGDLFNCIKNSRRLRLEDIKLYVAEIALAIHYLHSLNIVYRDLKPENIMLTEDGHIKLIDFNLSKELTQKELFCHSFSGTIEYLAPEIVQKEKYGKEVDWWSLGILIFEMVFNRTPFKTRSQEKTLSKIAAAKFMIPDCGNIDLVNLIDGLLRKDPKKRFCYKDVMSHPFFHPLDFTDVLKKKYKPLNLPKQISITKASQDLDHTQDLSSSIDQELIYIPDFYFDRSSKNLFHE